MIADELQQKLRAIEPDLETIQTFWENSHNEAELKRLEKLSAQPTDWQNPHSTKILKDLQRLKNQKELYLSLLANHKELLELLTLFEHDEKALLGLSSDVHEHCRNVIKFKIVLLLSDEDDSAHCFLSINSGAGGTESQDWAEILLRMYVRFCEREKFAVSVLDIQPGEGAGIKSATLFIKGKNSYGLLKGEQGIHRLVRISPFDSNKRRHTSFAAVFVMPEVTTTEITIDPKDLRIDTFRAGGAGGQHVNKTESAIRITHIPTGIVVQCQNERSQNQNKETAMKMLMAKLKQKAKEEQAAKVAAIEKKSIEWGSQIRSYVLHPYKMVKDHRTEYESPQPELVLDGDLMPFIENFLIFNAKAAK